MTDIQDNRPTLQTERLILRPFTKDDAPTVQKQCGRFEIADTTWSIPHPYPDGLAEDWISKHAEQFANGKCLPLAITLSQTGELIGGIGLDLDATSERADIGYLIYVDHWRNGYCTEAAGEAVRYGFEQLKLNRITGHHLRRNLTSGAVMKKIGMTHEGTSRQHVKKWDKFEDIECWAILASEFTG